MPTPIEAYREGYERGRTDSLGGRLAQVTMGMMRDDPGHHFERGYSDGASGRPFNPPPAAQPRKLIPKFSDNPLAWLLCVVVGVELWVLWQLGKAPFQLVGSLARNQKPSPRVLVKTAVVVVITISVAWFVPRANAPGALPSSHAVTQPAPLLPPVHANTTRAAIPGTVLTILGKWYPTDTVPRAIRCGLEFMRGGELRCYPYRFVENGEYPDRDPNKGTWAMKDRVLYWDSVPYPIAVLTAEEMVLDMGGSLVTFRRSRGSLPAF